MRILLDECVPRKLKREFPEHQVYTVTESGWMGQRNGNLLRLAQQSFDVFITVDRNLAFQQNVSNYDLGILVLRAVSNDINALRELTPAVKEALLVVQPRQVLFIGG